MDPVETTTSRVDASELAVPGMLLVGRYRLNRCLSVDASGSPNAERPRSTLWRAVDEVLSRPVAVRLVRLREPGTSRRPGDLPSADELVATVSQASHAADRRLARVFDVAVVDRGEEPLGLVVSEWVVGRPLHGLLDDGPLPAAEAVSLVDAAACALSAAAASGVHHGRLHAGNILVAPDGVRITGLGVAALVAGHPGGSAEGDVHGLGRLLYLTLTGVEAPTEGTPARRPRQLRGGIPRRVDAVAARLLSGAPAPPDAAGVAELLAPLPHRQPDQADEPVAPTRSPREAGPARRWTWRIVAVAGLAGVGIGGWLAGTSLGNVHTQQHSVPSISTPHSTGSGRTALKPIDLLHAPIHAFDPQGDGHENNDTARLALDQDPTTSWTTSTYRGSPIFGGLKHGVGLLIDVGKRTRVRQVRLAFDTTGASVQVRAATRRSRDLSAYPVVASASDTGHTASLTPRATTARYWLVWLTKLPQQSAGNYAEGIAEIRFYQ